MCDKCSMCDPLIRDPLFRDPRFTYAHKFTPVLLEEAVLQLLGLTFYFSSFSNLTFLVLIITFETASCWSSDVFSYMRRALSDRCPVVFCIIVSGTLLWNIVVCSTCRT